MMMADILKSILPPDAHAAMLARKNLHKALPKGQSLGYVEDLLARYVGAVRPQPLQRPKKRTFICCADHGVSAMSVSAYPPETTAQMTANYLIAKGGAANAFANFVGSDLIVADLGIATDTSHIPHLFPEKIAYGTKNSALGPAMTREQAIRSLEVGIRLAKEAVDDGVTVFLPGEMGISNTTASAAITAAICELPAEEATGRGTNISDQRLQNKINVVRQILQVNQPNPKDGLDVLMKVGGFELGCIAGLILGGAAFHALTILDGFNTGAAALIATTLAPEAKGYLAASHIAGERGHQAVLQKLGLHPSMNMNFCLGEAIGSSIVADFLDGVIDACLAVNSAEVAENSRRAFYAAADKVDESLGFLPLPLSATSFATKREPQPFPIPVPLPLSQRAMEEAQERIDNLAKPIYSLGRLEHIAVRLAGILHDARPSTKLPCALLRASSPLGFCEESPIVRAFILHAQLAPSLPVYLGAHMPLEHAWAIGRGVIRSLAKDFPLVALSLNMWQDERKAFLQACQQTQNVKEPAELFALLPKSLAPAAAFFLGAILEGAAQPMLLILDDEPTEQLAMFAERFSIGAKEHVLHIEPQLLDLSVQMTGGVIASLGTRVVNATLHMVNDMKTFAEASISVANDGPGFGRQVR